MDQCRPRRFPTKQVPSPLAGTDEILALLVRIGREHVRELTVRSDFPEPAAELAEGAVWFLDDVEAWIAEHGEALAETFKRN
jgi:prophage regulatory protein